MTPFRIAASLVTVVGIGMLCFVFWDWQTGSLAAEFFPDVERQPDHHLKGLLLALPVPLHVIFIGLIIQKKYLSPPWAKFAWFGITTSGMWLGVSLLLRVI